MSYFLRAGFLVEVLKGLEDGLKELDTILNDRDEDGGFAELRALLEKRHQGADPQQPEAREAWSRIRRSGRLVRELLEECRRANSVLRAMPCEPLLFTGAGETDRVVRLLDSLIAEAEGREDVAGVLRRRFSGESPG